MTMRLQIFTTACLCLAVSAFNIITPHPGEVISVDELYNLTWTTDGVPANFIVASIEIVFPDPALLYADTSEFFYSQGWDTFNISGTAGHYPLNLSLWWSPVYNELPHGSWSISLALYNLAENPPIDTMLNDTVKVNLTSSKVDRDQRPQLPPVKSFAMGDGSRGVRKASVASGVWPVALSIVIPVLFIALTIWLVRYRWKRHIYDSLSHKDDLKPSDPLSLSWPPAAAARDKVERSRRSDSTSPHRFPRSFVLAAFLAIAPLLALFTALVSLLGLYKVKPSTHSRTDFFFNESGSDPAAFYMDYDATRYTTVASWTSSIALLLPGFLTSLIWYRQTQQLESDTSLARYDKLLTPYQLSLLLNLKSGTLGSLWEYISYIIARRREKQARFLFEAGFVVLLSTLLGIGLWMADTWLHIGTSTVPFTSAFSYTASESEFILEPYGRALIQNCTLDYLDSIGQNYSCILESILSDVPPVLTDTVLYASIVSGRDDDTAIIPVTLGQDRMAYIGPASPRKQLDYRANTFAVRSLCKTIDEWCWLPYENGSVPSITYANCGQFIGVPANSSAPIAQATVVTQGVVGVVTSFFTDQQWQDIMSIYNTSNSFYTVSRLDSAIQPSIYGLPTHGTIFDSGPVYSNFIGCNTEFVNFTYTYVNGSIRSADVTPLEDLDMLNAIFPPALQNFDPFMTDGAATTALADDIDSAIENWIDTLHKHYFSLAAIATEDVDNIDQQERFTRLVARIPKAPLFTLLVLIVLSILFNSFILAMSLWRTSLGKTHPKQTIVSIAGLTAKTFESDVANTGHGVSDTWDLFQESKEESPSTRIGIGENSAGCHDFIAFGAQGAGLKDVVLDRDSEPQEELGEIERPKYSVTF